MDVFFKPQQWLLTSQPDEAAHICREIRVVLKIAPIEPGDVIVLRVGVVIALL